MSSTTTSTTPKSLIDVKTSPTITTTTLRNNLTKTPETTTTTTTIPTTQSITTISPIDSSHKNNNASKSGNNTETTTTPTTAQTINGSTTTIEYGPNKGPRVGDNDITESSVTKVTTKMPIESITDHITDFHVIRNATTTATSTTDTTFPPIEGTTIDVGDRMMTTNSPNIDDITTQPNVVAMSTGKSVLPMQCNNVNDCAPSEMCINNKCTKLCDPTNSNRSSVDCKQGICK